MTINIEWLKQCAYEIYKHKATAVSRAFLIALGIDPPKIKPKNLKVGDIVSAETYNDLQECFANGSSPMDWLYSNH